MEYVSIDKGIVSKLISKLLSKVIERRTGVKSKIAINKLIFKREGEPDCVHVELSASMPTAVFEKLMETLI